MNISHLLLCTSLLAAPVCAAQGLTETETETPASSSRLPAPLAQKIASGDFDGLQTELRSTLLKAGEQTKSEQKLLQNKQYRHLLDIHELLRVTGPDKVKAVFSKSAQDAAFIKTFLQDPAWMELYLGAGLIPENSPEGLQILSDIWKADGKSPDFRNYQSLATGLASVFSTGPMAGRLKTNSANSNPVRRYRIFKKLHQENKLHPGFIKLRPWEMRFVVGSPWDDKSYEWSNEHVNLPWRRYTAACWAAPYTGHNFFGDTIQGPLFYVPWRDLNTTAENTQIIGGVCGGLSYFGTMAAQAHGIPAYPVGQPGHCAYAVRVKRGASQTELMAALNRGINLSSFLIAIASAFLLQLIGLDNWAGIWGAIVTGLAVGIVIGKSTEHYTSHDSYPCRKIAHSAKTGPATVIISGIGIGMISTCIPVITVVVGTVLAYGLASGDWHFTGAEMSKGLYGIGIAAVGMLSTLGLTLATDAYGPISDNAGGNAEMSKLDPEVRRRTDALDALGNTTAATGKGFAIGSAALTALALMASYIEKVKEVGADVTFQDFSLMNPVVLVGLFIGACLPFVFAALTMNSVGRAAQSVVLEVRRQFREITGLMDGKADPDYARCVDLCTKASLHEMVLPTIIAVVCPIVVGLILGHMGVVGMLAGATVTGFLMAIYMANAGGAWDNAKKYIEAGHFGGKGSDCHKAGVVGDTVGDPFKDTSGPAINILIKLLSMVSIVFAGLVVNFHLL